MPGVISRSDGRILSAPVMTEADTKAMAEAIAKAMVQAAKPEIRRRVSEFTERSKRA